MKSWLIVADIDFVVVIRVWSVAVTVVVILVVVAVVWSLMLWSVVAARSLLLWSVVVSLLIVMVIELVVSCCGQLRLHGHQIGH